MGSTSTDEISGTFESLERKFEIQKRKIMEMALEKQHFDLEFFMKSTDVGLYNVAKKIFSHLDPLDLNNLWEIGKKNKTFEEFLKKERNFLWEKFEKATLKILKTVIGYTISERRLKNTPGVSVRILTKKPGPFSLVTITGNLQEVFNAVNHIHFHDMFRQKYCYIEQFEGINSEVLRSLREKMAIKKMNQLKLESKKPTDTSDKL